MGADDDVLEREARESTDLGAKNHQAASLEASDQDATDLEATDLNGKDFDARDLQAKDLETKGLEAKDLVAGDLNTDALDAETLAREAAEQAGDLPVYERFSKRVCHELGYYVYRLVDPRDGETFYVGRGVNNRCFDHMEEAEDALFGGRRSKKTDRINAIHSTGQKVQVFIHRHALRDDDETGTLEAAMIEAYPDLTNKVKGEGTSDYGSRPVGKVIKDYDLPPAQFGRHRCILVSLTKRWPMADDDAPTSWFDIYARARYGWSLDIKRAEKADYVVAHARGIVQGVFEIDRWLPSTDPVFSVFPTPEKAPAWGFVGGPASWLAREAWLGRRVPDKHRARFGRKVEYVNC